MKAAAHMRIQEHSGHEPQLRLLDSSGRQGTDDRPMGSLRPSKSSRRCILLAGADAKRRKSLRKELAVTLPAGTKFLEAEESWQLLQQAPASRMVMLTGDLSDISSDALTRLLGYRHPTLPVLTLNEGQLSNMHH
jgi:hypothetical protein